MMHYAKTFGFVYAVLALAILILSAPGHASADSVGERFGSDEILKETHQVPRR